MGLTFSFAQITYVKKKNGSGEDEGTFQIFKFEENNKV